MKFRILLILLCVGKITFAQRIKFWIYDTSSVSCFYAAGKITPDTVASLKKNAPLNGARQWGIYWDREKKQKYLEYDIDQKNQPWITWYRNGQKDEEIHYDQTHVVYYRGWYADGALKGELKKNGDTLTWYYYYNSGKIKKKEIQTSAFEYEENWCENGQLLGRDTISSDILSSITSYYCNGNKKNFCRTNHVNLFGKWMEWYENGQLKVEGQYDGTVSKALERKYGSSKQQGTWKYYNESGKLIKEEIYKNGEVISTKEY